MKPPIPVNRYVAPKFSDETNNRSALADDDSTLVGRVLTGDTIAFETIVSRYRTKIQRYAYTILRNPADAEEIAQDTFVRAYAALDRFRGESSLSTWLHRIALNAALSRYTYFIRRRYRDMVSLFTPLGTDSNSNLSDLIAAEVQDPAQRAAESEFVELVEYCMNLLEPEHREILDLRIKCDTSYEDIAATLGINLGTVKSRIGRAREKLRELLVTQAPEFKTPSPKGDYFLIGSTHYGCEAIIHG